MSRQDIMELETEKFLARTVKSFELYREAIETTPFGVHSNYRFVDPYPLYGSRSKGATIWDADGNDYIDFNMGFGALVTGHAHPVLVDAVSEQIKNGNLLGLEFEDSQKLAKLMIERFRVDMIRFSSTGMEATMNAIRFARAASGRNKILKFEGCYHGSQDSALVSVKPSQDRSGDPRSPTPVPASKGVPSESIKNVLVAPFNDIESVERIARQNRDDFAGVILEPIAMNMGFILPEKGFLEGLRRVCDELGGVLIFDEVKTCGKYYGGVTERFGVQPDLKVMGKAIAGGFPLSAVGGKRKIMEVIAPGIVAHAGTFNSNPVSVTAGLVTLSEILTRNAFDNILKHNQVLSGAYNDVVKDEHLKATVCADGVSGVLSFSPGAIHNWREFQKSDVGRWSLYYLMMINRGIIPAGTGPDEQWTISVQHSADDIDQHVETFKQVAPSLKDFELTVPIVEAI